METSTLMETTYVYEDYYEEYYEVDNIEPSPSPTASLIILSIVVLLSLIGNILVVVVSVFCMRLRSLTTIFILNLALSDLLFTVGLVFDVCDHIWGLTFVDAMCKLVDFIASTGFYSNIVLLVLMSVQRYITVVHPLSAWKKGRCIRNVLICAWVVSIWAASPDLVYAEAISDSGGCTYRIIALLAITYRVNLVFVCTFLFLGICYIRILKIILKSPTNQKHRTTGLTFFLVATFFICWAPYNIVKFLFTLNYFQILASSQVLNHLYHASYICRLLAATRCCLNPVIFGLFGVKFRTTVREIFQRRTTLNSAQMGTEEHSDSLESI